jgi:hypothetical protein
MHGPVGGTRDERLKNLMFPSHALSAERRFLVILCRVLATAEREIKDQRADLHLIQTSGNDNPTFLRDSLASCGPCFYGS